ncbi:hypothetical protein XI05_25750 [Bradyrhizobium sp. CCBAU 11357]|nr:hypothetical protein [Bradyrhizobium sp. CCBAU 11357]
MNRFLGKTMHRWKKRSYVRSGTLPEFLDTLHIRALAAITKSRELQSEKKRLHREYVEHRRALQFAILESAMARIDRP